MSERVISPEVQGRIAEYCQQTLGLLNRAAEIVGGSGAKVEEVFDHPTQVRNDAPKPEWSDEQVLAVKEVISQFGYGAEETVGSGLTGGVRIAEGGKIWKIEAELAAIAKEDQPSVIMIAGSPNRRPGEDEHDYFVKKNRFRLPVEATEFTVAQFLADRLTKQDSKPSPPEPLYFGYELAEGNPLVREATGQISYAGRTALSQSVMLIRVDREDYIDDQGEHKYRFQPGSTRLMTLVAEILSLQGHKNTPVGLATSNSYSSRQVSVVRAGLQAGREFGGVYYGRGDLKALEAPVPPEIPLNQIPGDLRVMYDEVLALQAELNDLASPKR